MALGSAARDRLYVESFSINTGETIQMPILMDNDTTYCAFQTDLYLPEGLEVTVEDDEYFIDLTHRASGNHIVSVFPQEDGALRIMVTSQSAVALSGNSGAVAMVEITALRDISNGLVELRNSLTVESTGKKHDLDNELAVVNEASNNLRGDINGDDRVDVADMNMVINIILGKAQASDFPGQPDMDNSGQVDVADMNTIINIILGKE